MKNRKGFTLLEIIIVIIIIGVLASLALPKFFQTITFSKSTEALNALGTIKRAVDRCSMMDGVSQDYTPCGSFNNIGIEAPTSTIWSYGISSAANVVTVNANFVGSEAANWIKLTINNTANVVKAGNGIFSGIR